MSPSEVRGGKGEIVSGTNLVAMGNLVAWAGCLQSVYGECWGIRKIKSCKYLPYTLAISMEMTKVSFDRLDQKDEVHIKMKY